MAKSKKGPDLGEKQLCPECEKKFYDLAKRPAICPYCATSFDPASIVAASIPKPVKTATPKKDDPEEDMDAEEVDPEDIDEEDIDQDEAAAKELELDGDATFGGSGGEDGDDDPGNDTPDMDGFSTSDDEDGVDADDEDEQDIMPPTGNEDDVEEEDAE